MKCHNCLLRYLKGGIIAMAYVYWRGVGERPRQHPPPFGPYLLRNSEKNGQKELFFKAAPPFWSAQPPF